MREAPENPTLAPAVRWFFVIVALIVVFGSSLLLAPTVVRPHWPWVITPFNAAFLGSIYLTELCLLATLLLHNHWDPARMVLPMALCFTSIVTVVSLFYLSRFDGARWTTPAWFVAYLGSIIITGVFTWRYRYLPLPTPVLGFGWRVFFMLQTIVMGLYGLSLLITPALATAFWPWQVDTFHSQVYSAVFLTGALGSALEAQASGPLAVWTLGITELTLGASVLIGVAGVDASLHRINWHASGTLAWLAMFGLIGSAGLCLLLAMLANRQKLPYAIRGSPRR